MSRPTDLPNWATNANYAVGPYSGQPNKSKPSAGVIGEGFDPGSGLPAEWPNWLFNNHGQWISYLDSATAFANFGDGSDGAVTLDGTLAAPAWATKSGSVYTMTRDCYCTNLTVTGAGVQLFANGFRIFCKGTLTTAGGAIIHCNGAAGSDGGNGSGGAGGAQGNVGTILGGAAGGAGNAGSGSVGGAQLLAAGGAGGAGGLGASAGGGVGVVATSAVGLAQNPGMHTFSPRLFGYLVGAGFGSAFASQTAYISPYGGGAGGGGGGGDGGTVRGGGGGAGGGLLLIAAAFIVLANATDLQAKGGNGGNGSILGGTTGGGGGGGGGNMELFCLTLTIASGSLSAAQNCAGGAGGFGITNPTNTGAAGATGHLFQTNA